MTSVMSPTLLYMVIARSPSDAAISQRDSFASLGMTNVGLFVGQDTSYVRQVAICESVRETIKRALAQSDDVIVRLKPTTSPLLTVF